jgi:putative Ca2+/H+ antiporter (TMEM165/GDT1 family)
VPTYPILTPKVVSANVTIPASWKVFGSTFLTIFLAEFGDKTQLSTLLMSAESQAPWVVFLGSTIALVTTSLLSVLIGRWLATKLAPKTVETAAGLSLLLISVMLFWDVLLPRG